MKQISSPSAYKSIIQKKHKEAATGAHFLHLAFQNPTEDAVFLEQMKGSHEETEVMRVSVDWLYSFRERLALGKSSHTDIVE